MRMFGILTAERPLTGGGTVRSTAVGSWDVASRMELLLKLHEQIEPASVVAGKLAISFFYAEPDEVAPASTGKDGECGD